MPLYQIAGGSPFPSSPLAEAVNALGGIAQAQEQQKRQAMLDALQQQYIQSQIEANRARAISSLQGPRLSPSEEMKKQLVGFLDKHPELVPTWAKRELGIEAKPTADKGPKGLVVYNPQGGIEYVEMQPGQSLPKGYRPIQASNTNADVALVLALLQAAKNIPLTSPEALEQRDALSRTAASLLGEAIQGAINRYEDQPSGQQAPARPQPPVRPSAPKTQPKRPVTAGNPMTAPPGYPRDMLTWIEEEIRDAPAAKQDEYRILMRSIFADIPATRELVTEVYDMLKTNPSQWRDIRRDLLKVWGLKNASGQ